MTTHTHTHTLHPTGAKLVGVQGREVTSNNLTNRVFATAEGPPLSTVIFLHFERSYSHKATHLPASFI